MIFCGSSTLGERIIFWRQKHWLTLQHGKGKSRNLISANESSMTLNERAYYLAEALTSAKSAASLGAEDVEFTSGLQERIEVAQVQIEIARAVEGHPDMGIIEKEQVLARLNSDLLGLDAVSCA